MTDRYANSSLNFMLVAIVMASFASNFEAHAQESKEEIDATIEAKHKEIEAELKSIEIHPWAGSYKQVGRDEADVIAIAPSGNVVAFQDFRGLHFENSGTAKAVGLELQVKWDYDESQERTCSLGDQLLIVPWGNASFLIARGAVHSFCIDYRNQDLRTSSPERRDYVRFEGEALLDGKPQLPDEFKKFWDLPPIESQITSVDKVARKKGDYAGDRKLTCTINKGSKDHVFVGMQMFARDKRNEWNFTVTKVEEQSATLETSLKRPFKEPKVGLAVTSN